MTSEHETPVRISLRTNTDIFKDGTLSTKHIHVQDRLLNGLKFLGLFWLAGALCVLVPVMHFFLVPLAAIAGIVVFFVKFSQTEVRDAGSVACPKCGTAVTLKRSSFNWPIIETCSSCRYGLIVDRIETDGPSV
jgi:hypothetical protein